MGPVFIGPCLHACMKDFGYGHQARPDTRLCGAFRMLITAQSRTNDVGLLTARPFAPDRATLAPCSLPSRRGLATTQLVVTTQRRPALTAAARGASRNSRVGTKKRLQVEQRNYPKKGHDAHGPVIHPLDRRVRRQELAARPEFPLDSPHTRVGKIAAVLVNGGLGASAILPTRIECGRALAQPTLRFNVIGTCSSVH